MVSPNVRQPPQSGRQTNIRVLSAADRKRSFSIYYLTDILTSSNGVACNLLS